MNGYHRNKPLLVLAGVLVFSIATSTEAGTVSINLESTSGTEPVSTFSGPLEGDYRKIYWQPLSPGETVSDLPYGDPAEYPRTAISATHTHTGTGAPFFFYPPSANEIQKIGLRESRVEIANLPPNQWFQIVIIVIPRAYSQHFKVNGRPVKTKAWKHVPFWQWTGLSDYPGFYEEEISSVLGVDSSADGKITIETATPGSNIAGIQCQGVFQGEKAPRGYVSVALKRDFRFNGVNNNPNRAVLKIKKRRSGCFYAACRNRDDYFDQFFLGADWNSRKLRIRITPIAGSKNITAQARRFDFAFPLAPDQGPRYKRFKVFVKPKRRIPRSAREEVRLSIVSSTRDPKRMDSATGFIFETN